VTSGAALSASGVVKRYDGRPALDGVSLDVAAGELVALVGESGSGKTTLLRSFNRLVDPDDGRITVDGADVRTLDPVELRRRTGYVPQDGGLLPHWTLRRNVALVPWLRGEPDALARSAEALALVGLEPGRFADRYPHELSGGQRQRAALARALAGRPVVILLDEPFGALDSITRSDMQAMFLELRSRYPVGGLLVTHDLQEAARLADRVSVMRGGRIEQTAPTRDLLAHPATPYVARLLARAGLHA